MTGIVKNLLESRLPDKVYHGTSEDMWAESGDETNFNLYVTDDPKEAQHYAGEVGWGDWEEGDPEPVPIVVEFDLNTLRKLPGVELDPDWGWLEGSEWRDTPNDQLPDWLESLNKVRSFVVAGFQDDYKKHGKIVWRGGQ